MVVVLWRAGAALAGTPSPARAGLAALAFPGIYWALYLARHSLSYSVPEGFVASLIVIGLGAAAITYALGRMLALGLSDLPRCAFASGLLSTLPALYGVYRLGWWQPFAALPPPWLQFVPHVALAGVTLCGSLGAAAIVMGWIKLPSGRGLR
jgi:hypothetical protein